MISKTIFRSHGQSLIEVLIALSLGALIIGSATGAIVLTVRLNNQNRLVQSASFLAQEISDNAKPVSSSNWVGLYNLTKGASTKYYFYPSASGFGVVTGTEGVIENDLKNGLVGLWKFDETSGANAYDSSIKNNAGTLSGTPTRTSSCQISDCLTFSGTGQYVNIPPPTGFPTTSITVSAWVYLTSHITSNDLVTNNFSVSGGWDLFADSLGNAMFGVFNGTSQFNASGCSTAFTTSAWHHLLGTYDGTTVKVYLDGVQCTTTSALSSQTLYTAGSIRIGDADGTSFSHKIDDVRIYNRALS